MIRPSMKIGSLGQVGAAAGISVVADEHVARPHRLGRVALQDLRYDADEAAQMHRDVLGLAKGRAVPIEECGRAVAPLFDVRRETGANQRLAHLLDDRRQGAADYLDRDRVDAVGRDCVHGNSSSRFRYGSTVAVVPGTTKVVASICSTIAGPSMRLPARSLSRS